MSKKEVMKKEESKEITTYNGSAWGSAEGIDQDDIIIPRIHCAQGLSDIVNDESVSVSAGDLYDSLDKKVLAKKGEPLELIFFDHYKTWQICERTDPSGKWEYKKTEPCTAENINLPYMESTPEGTELKRDNIINFFAIMPSEIEEGAFPFVLSFKRSSRFAGRKLLTLAAKLAAHNKPLAAKVLYLDRRLEKNDKGTFYVLDTRVSRESLDNEMKAAFDWYKSLRKVRSNIVVDDSELKAQTDNQQSENDNDLPF